MTHPFRFRLSRIPAALLLLLSGAAGTGVSPSRAADLIEPWDPGFTDLELYAVRNSGGDNARAAVLGFGLPASFSIGASLANDGQDTASYGVCGSWTTRAGTATEIDIVAAYDTYRSRLRSIDRDRTWLAGTEWSFHHHRLVPYARLMFRPDDDEVRGISPIAGLMMPLGSRVELHLELAADMPRQGTWPVELVIGPNVDIGGGVELLPEVAVILDQERGEADWRVGFGVVLNPRAGASLWNRNRATTGR